MSKANKDKFISLIKHKGLLIIQNLKQFNRCTNASLIGLSELLTESERKSVRRNMEKEEQLIFQIPSYSMEFCI